jgi:hypothetical protein
VKHRRIGAVVVGVAAALVSLSAMSTGAVASGAGYVLDLELNEPAGATVAVDSSGLGHDGAIGSHLIMNGAYADWDRHLPAEGIYYGYDHLIAVPDAADGSLDPGTGNFSVEFAFRTKEKWGNLIQKGQAATRGGQVKFQIPGGRLTCMFKTSSGTATAGSRQLLLNDGKWHDVRCVRTTSAVTMFVDGDRVSRTNHSTGALDNTKPWTIGGKLNCGPESGADSCDYFAGDIDFVRITKG